MTTIAFDYENKQIAIDSRCTVGNLIMTDDLIKSVSKDGVRFFLGGANSDIQKFIEQYPEVSLDGDVSGFLVKDHEAYSAQNIEGNFFESKLAYNDADGSGYMFALAALDFGRTAKEAIEYAATRDSGTGGMVHVYDIEKGEFI